MSKITFHIEETLVDGFPHPQPATKFIPEWYKNMKKNFLEEDLNPKRLPAIVDPNSGSLQGGLTLKNCIPIRDYLFGGYIIPLWVDLVSKIDEDGAGFSWLDQSQKNILGHSIEQVKGSILEKHAKDSGIIFKLNSPWFIKTPPGYSCLFYSPWFHEPDIEIIPAIVDTDTQHEINFPFIYNVKGDNFIKRGTPTVQVLPFKRESWSHEIKTVDSEFRTRHATLIRSMLVGAYRTFRHSKKVFR